MVDGLRAYSQKHSNPTLLTVLKKDTEGSSIKRWREKITHYLTTLILLLLLTLNRERERERVSFHFNLNNK